MNLDDLMVEIREETRARDAADHTDTSAVADRVMNADLDDKDYAALQARRAERARLRDLGFRIDE